MCTKVPITTNTRNIYLQQQRLHQTAIVYLEQSLRTHSRFFASARWRLLQKSDSYVTHNGQESGKKSTKHCLLPFASYYVDYTIYLHGFIAKEGGVSLWALILHHPALPMLLHGDLLQELELDKPTHERIPATPLPKMKIIANRLAPLQMFEFRRSMEPVKHDGSEVSCQVQPCDISQRTQHAIPHCTYHIVHGINVDSAGTAR